MLWKMIDTSKDFEWEKPIVLLRYFDLWDKVAWSHKGSSEIRLVLKGMSRGEERELTHVKKKKNCKCFTQSLIYYLYITAFIALTQAHVTLSLILSYTLGFSLSFLQLWPESGFGAVCRELHVQFPPSAPSDQDRWLTFFYMFFLCKIKILTTEKSELFDPDRMIQREETARVVPVQNAPNQFHYDPCYARDSCFTHF